jgi:DNA-binding NarL/FixJ family response regulator
MINAGADAFVSKNASAHELVAAIWRACRGVAEEP